MVGMALDGYEAVDRAEDRMAETLVKMGRDMVDRAQARARRAAEGSDVRDGNGRECIDTEGEAV